MPQAQTGRERTRRDWRRPSCALNGPLLGRADALRAGWRPMIRGADRRTTGSLLHTLSRAGTVGASEWSWVHCQHSVPNEEDQSRRCCVRHLRRLGLSTHERCFRDGIASLVPDCSVRHRQLRAVHSGQRPARTTAPLRSPATIATILRADASTSRIDNIKNPGAPSSSPRRPGRQV